MLALAEAIDRARLAGVFDVVPACASLAVHADPDVVDELGLTRLLETLVRKPLAVGTVRSTHAIPVCYEPPFGLDLENVSRASGCALDGVTATRPQQHQPHPGDQNIDARLTSIAFSTSTVSRVCSVDSGRRRCAGRCDRIQGIVTRWKNRPSVAKKKPKLSDRIAPKDSLTI